jgi:hypothetical protein
VTDPAADNEVLFGATPRSVFVRSAVMRRYECDADGTGWHDALLMDLRAEDLDQPA